MKKQAKLIGSLGVATALSMSIFAVTPVMAADLVPINRNGSTSADVTIKVTVVGEAPSVQFAKPMDGERYIGKTIPVTTNYTQANNLKYELIRINSDGTKTSYDLPIRALTEDGVVDGTDELEINIEDYGGKFGDYILRVSANGSGTATDSVQFELVSFNFEEKGKDAETYDPIITIDEAPGIDHALIQVFDKDGNPIFDEPLEVKLDPDQKVDVTLPLSKYGVPEGDYTVVGTPYDREGTIIDINKELVVRYTPAPAPDVPDTGFFASLNLSRQDMVSTGLALLIVCGFFGILLIARKSKNEKRR